MIRTKIFSFSLTSEAAGQFFTLSLQKNLRWSIGVNSSEIVSSITVPAAQVASPCGHIEGPYGSTVVVGSIRIECECVSSPISLNWLSKNDWLVLSWNEPKQEAPNSRLSIVNVFSSEAGMTGFCLHLKKPRKPESQFGKFKLVRLVLGPCFR